MVQSRRHSTLDSRRYPLRHRPHNHTRRLSHFRRGSASVSASVKDLAGNIATATVSGLHIDKITGEPQLAPTRWYNHPVTFTVTATDTGSGVVSVSGPITYSGPDSSTASVTGQATDLAGNTGTASVTFKYDSTPPTITGAATTQPNSNGWYKSNVVVHFEGTDSTSGVYSVTPDQTVSTEGTGNSVIGTVVDKAGNTASVTVGGINIDKTPPTITGWRTPGPNSNGWNNVSVTTFFLCSDSLSGIASRPSNVTLTNEGGNQYVTGIAYDKAGNSASYTINNINIDKTPPTITVAATSQPDKGTWYSHSVTIHFTATDSISGISYCTPDTIIQTEGYDQSVSGRATDLAGNTAATTVSGINIANTHSKDTSIAAGFNGTPIAAGKTIWFNSNFQAAGVTAPTTIYFYNSKITINGVTYTAPDGRIVFTSSVTKSVTTFDSTTNSWVTTVPLSGSDEVLLSGFTLPLYNATIPGGSKGDLEWKLLHFF